MSVLIHLQLIEQLGRDHALALEICSEVNKKSEDTYVGEHLYELVKRLKHNHALALINAEITEGHIGVIESFARIHADSHDHSLSLMQKYFEEVKPNDDTNAV